MRTPHTSVRQGKRVRIVLKDGTILIEKFMGHKSGKIILEKHTIPTIAVRAFSIYKNHIIDKLENED